MKRTELIQIPLGADGSALTPEQKRFNALIKQIEQARRTLAAWRDNIVLYQRAHAQRVMPLTRSVAEAQRTWAFALDAQLNERHWTKAERGTLRELICDVASELLHGAADGHADGHSTGEDDAALKALFDKHSEVDFDTEQQESREVLKRMMEEMTGIDLGDSADIESDKDLFKRMHEGMAAAQAQAEAHRAQNADPAKPIPSSGRRRRKTAAQQRRETEAELANQSVREIFRKLASALHPDRETDPERREAKTALMQTANQAYAANDLLALLELQLQIEQVDASHIATAGALRLKHYNKVLAEQLTELKAETARMQTGFRFNFGVEFGWGLSPLKLLGLLDPQVRQLRAALAMHQRDMRMLADKVATKRWLKREKQRMREAEFDDDFGDEFF